MVSAADFKNNFDERVKTFLSFRFEVGLRVERQFIDSAVVGLALLEEIADSTVRIGRLAVNFLPAAVLTKLGKGNAYARGWPTSADVQDVCRELMRLRSGAAGKGKRAQEG